MQNSPADSTSSVAGRGGETRSGISRTALVTGGTGGVGRAVVRSLAENGFDVLATGRARSTLAELEESRKDNDGVGGIRTAAADLTRPEDRTRLYEAVRDDGSGLDVLVLAHGLFVSGMGPDLEEPELQGILDANLASRVMIFRELIPELQARRGYVFAVNSTASRSLRPEVSVYAASMAGSDAFFRAVAGADEVRGKVRICSILLGRTATRMQEQVARSESQPSRPERLLAPEAVGSFILKQILGPADEVLSEVVLRPAHVEESEP